MENRLEMHACNRSDLDFLLTHLKSDDKKKLDFEHSKERFTDEWLKNKYLTQSKIKYTMRYDGKLMFCFGVFDEYPWNEDPLNGYLLWWMPSVWCETQKQGYFHCATKAIEILKKLDKPVWTYTATWYKKNFHASKRFGFMPVITTEVYNQEFLVSKLEVNK